MKNIKTKTNLIWHWNPSSFVRSTINNSYKAIWSDSRKRTQGLWQKGCWTLVQLTWWLSFSLGWCLLAFGDLLCLLSRWLWRVRVLRIKTCSSSELSQSNARMASNVWGDFWPLDDERSHASEATDARYSSVHHERSQNPSQNGLLFKDCLSNAIERVFVRFWQENC